MAGTLLRVALGAVGLLWALLLLAWMALHWIILPHIDEWRGTLERHVGQAIGAQLRIGRIDVQSRGWVPALDLRELRLLDRDGREALYLARVQAAVAPQSLLTFDLRLQQVLVDGARLEVRRDAEGRLQVAGFDWEHGSGVQGGRLRDWVLAQQEFVVRDSELVWHDATRDAPPLALTQATLVMRNGLRRHEFRVDAVPPAQWGERFTLQGRFTQPLLAARADLAQWSGTLYVDLPHADVAELRRYATLPFELGEGDGALRAWVDIDTGVSRRLTLDLALRAVSMRLHPALERLQFEQVQGRLEAARDADGVRLDVRRLSFMTGDGLQWPAGDLHVAWRQPQDLSSLPPSSAPVSGGEFSAERLDLDVMARTAARLPLPEGLRRLLRAVAPQGVVEGLKGRWEGPLAEPTRYQVGAKLSGLTLAAAASPVGDPASPGRPGLRGGQLQFEATERGGEARMLVKSGALVFPGVWAEPEVPLDEFDATLAWRIAPAAGGLPALQVQVRQARFANADMMGELEGSWSTGAGADLARGGRYPGRLELSGRLQRGKAARVARYLPLGIPQSARDYVQQAVRSGEVGAATFAVKGDLWDFPFHSARDGTFRITAQARDVEFAYVPDEPAGAHGRPAWHSPWPAFTHVNGQIEFDRAAMRLSGVSAAMHGYQLRQVKGQIADLGADRPVLAIEGQGSGPVADLLRYLRATPLGGWIGPAIEPIAASGGSELKLALDIPLAQPEHTRVRGSVQLPGNELRLRADLPPLAGARGRIDFTEHDFAVRGASARVLGGEVAIEGGSTPDGALRFTAQGVAGAEALRAAGGLGPLARLATRLRGQAAYRATLGIVHGHAEVGVVSDLVGMQIDLPEPLAKPAASALPLRVQNTLQPDGSGVARDLLQIDLGELVHARYERELADTGPRVVRGSLAVREALPAPAAGVVANLNLGRFAVDAWDSALDALGGDPAQAVDGGYLPRTVNLRADELRFGGHRLAGVAAQLRRQGEGRDASWRAEVRAEQLEGSIEYRPARGVAVPGLVKARLRRASVAGADPTAEVHELLVRVPSSVPALDVVIDDFELRGKKLGRLQIDAVNRMPTVRDGAREWQLDRLELVAPEAVLAANGRWQVGGRMRLDFKLDLADSGAFAERLGAGRPLRGGKGQVSGQLSWAGSPLSLDYPSLDGQLAIALDKGQFLHADPGGARLLGVLSLQALPRRLTLDFRDLFQEGFAFDSVLGDVAVARGVASTRNLAMRGAQATVLMQGSADLRRETQDLQVLVVPNFDATGAALATFAINPAIGLGALFAQWALREPMIAASTREYRISGSWGDPQVTSVQRTADSPRPSIDPAPQPAPAPPTARNQPSG